MPKFNFLCINMRQVLSMTLLGYPQSTVHDDYNRLSFSIFFTISLEKAVLLGHFVLWLEFFTLMYCNLSKHYSCYTNHQVLHSTDPCSAHSVHLCVKYVSKKRLLLYKESNDWLCINTMSVFCAVGPESINITHYVLSLTGSKKVISLVCSPFYVEQDVLPV